MPRYSTSSQNKLFTCHQDLQTLFREVIKHYDCTIIEGFRDKEAQNAAFDRGNSKIRWPNGRHNKSPSMAVDALPYPIRWDDEKTHYWFAGFVLGIAQMLKDEGKMKHGVRWGGAWNGIDSFNTKGMLNDLGHFELID